MMFAQLMGLHKVRVNGRQDMIWWAIFQTDRFSSLMLGTPYSISESHCNMGFRGKDLRADFTPFGFICRLALIVGKVIDQLHSLSDAPHTLAMAIDQELNCCTAEMPAEFWIRELYAPKDLGKANGGKVGFSAKCVLPDKTHAAHALHVEIGHEPQLRVQSRVLSCSR